MLLGRWRRCIAEAAARSSAAPVATRLRVITVAAAMPGLSITAIMGIMGTTAALAITMAAAGAIRIPATIQAGLTDRIATIHIRTTGVIRIAAIRTTAEAMAMTLEPLQQSSAVWVSLASIVVWLME